MLNEYEKIKESANFLLAKGITAPEVGIVLGTGLSRMVGEIETELEIPYSEIPNFPDATVEFHPGKLIYGKVNGRQVLAMSGRYHYYEGYDMKQITLPVRVMKLLGVKFLLLSNAAGAMNLAWSKGDLMLIRDHINLLPSNPLIGKNLDEFGPRFPDMSQAYSNELNEIFMEVAREYSITLHQGVYVSVPGPQLESPAEYRYLHCIGADAVGMSTVPEVIVANHCGIPCAAVSVLTDECDPDNLQPVNIAEIIDVAGKAEIKLTKLFKEVINRIEVRVLNE